MSWVAPSSRTTGTIITATIWNQDVVDNPIALRAGAIAMASQAALDLVGCSSSSQFARVPNTTVDGYLLLGTTGALPTWGTGPLARYAPTLANVQNQSSRTTTVSFTIPANSMADYDVIAVIVSSLEKNDTGVADTIAVGFTAGAGSNVTIETLGWAAGSTEYKNTRVLLLQRVGSAIYGYMLVNRTANLSTLSSFQAQASTPTNFTSDFTLAVTWDFTAADANLYYKPQAAKVLHFKG